MKKSESTLSLLFGVLFALCVIIALIIAFIYFMSLDNSWKVFAMIACAVTAVYSLSLFIIGCIRLRFKMKKRNTQVESGMSIRIVNENLEQVEAIIGVLSSSGFVILTIIVFIYFRFMDDYSEIYKIIISFIGTSLLCIKSLIYYFELKKIRKNNENIEL